ncbi:aminopeptidase N [alpha proteobacterium U9-1i]|nr:aminopeptidase N [alpha proteobacterium U9-1i]
MKRLLLAAMMSLALAVPASGQDAPRTNAQGQVRLTDQVRPLRYDMVVTPDAENLTLAGEVTIEIEVLSPQQEIVVNALDMEFGRISLNGVGATSTRYQASDQTLHMSFGRRPVAVGTHRLSIAYRGQIYRQAQGLFAQDYDIEGGGTGRMLVSQFQAADARRFVPSFDEPAFRSVFDISVIAPANRGVISNMPEASSQMLANGMKRTRFAPSPSMPTYLMFLGVGDFERISQTVDGVEVSIITKRGDIEMGRFALQAGVETLHWFNEYFGTPYPLPKLDIIAAPGGGGFAAMENWGAILFFEQYLLVDPETTSEFTRQFIYTTVAHEIAHMWFGDLVTMQWWDDIWLNEGFASWMENKVTDALHPEWNIWDQAQGQRQAAMLLDARPSTHPVIVPIADVEQANQAFDAITYQKGYAVVRMMEEYVGEDAFRQGVRAYMQQHAYGNTVSSQFWDAIETAAGRPVRQIADDFTRQPGVPLVNVEAAACRNNAQALTLRQGEFTSLPVSRAAPLWRVPVRVQRLDGQGRAETVTGESRTATLNADGCGPFIVNPDQIGYYRVQYPRAAFDRLAQNFARIAPADQLGILYDVRALGRAGVIPASDFLTLARRVRADGDPNVWATIAGELGAMDALYTRDDPRRARFRTYARGLLNPVFRRVGWAKVEGESDNTSILRAALIGTLSALEDPAFQAEALRRYRSGQIDGAVRGAVLGAVGGAATPDVFDDMLSRARAATETLEKQTLYGALANTRDPVLAQRVLNDIVFTEDVNASLGPNMILAVGGNHPDMAYAFAEAHPAELTARLDPFSLRSFLPNAGAASNDPAMLRRIRAYIDSIPATARRVPEATYANMNERLQTRERRVNEVSAFVGARSR